MDIWWGCLLEPFRPSGAKRRNLLARPARATALRPDLPCGKRIQVAVGGYGDDGCCAAGLPPFALLPGILSSLVASSSSSRVPCGLLLEVQGTGTGAPRLRVSYHPRRLASSSREVNSDAVPSPTEAAIDIKLPRRSLLVQFTCNACGERTKRLINRVAYESGTVFLGTVFLQCAGCQVYHKFVDNLGLVVEYDLQEENELQGENVVNPNSED